MNLAQPLSLQYFGADWAAMVFTFTAIYLLGNQSRHGFSAIMCGNACWVVVGIMASSTAMALANIVFLLMNFRGLVRWMSQDGGAGI